MLTFIRNSLELKIILSLIVVIGCVIGVFTFIDIRLMRADTIRTSEQTLQALAAAVKGSVNASMKKGHREDVQRILEEVKIPSLIDSIIIYDERGRALKSVGIDQKRASDREVPARIVESAPRGDRTDIHKRAGRYYLSYYSPIENRPECFRCHGRRNVLNGILRIDFSLRDIDGLMAARRNRILVWAGVMIASLITSLVILLRIVVHRPVRDLRNAMSRAESGESPVSAANSGHDELADLKRSFIGLLTRINALHQTNLDKEKELARSQEVARFRAELQTMFNAMPDGVILVDTDLRIVQSNPRAYELLPGLALAGGRIDPERLKEAGCPNHGLRTALNEGKICEHQCKLTLPTGEVRHLHSICAPIVDDRRVVNIVEVIRDITERVKTEHELEEKTAELLAANRLLSQIAITDSLTQVYNRRHFDEILYKETKRYNRRKYSYLSLMMIDIDHFKDLNDRYGHLAGDAVLREIAKLLKEGVRETDTIARYGGEEFLIVMPDTHLEGAVHKAETLRKRVQAKEFPGHESPIHITISIGVSIYASGPPQDLVNAADHALYEAKRSGRNRVVVNRPGA